MRGILTYWRIPASLLVSAVFVFGAYVLARNIENPPAAQASEESALLYAIATKDTDADGLPDWEEALYGTDPNNPDTRKLGMTDGAAVDRGLIVPRAIADIPLATSTPGAVIDPSLPPAPAEDTLTATFSRNFFMRYLEVRGQKGRDLTEEELKAVSDEALATLASSVVRAPDFKALRDIAVGASGPEAMKSYAVSAEAVLLANTHTATTSEIAYLRRAVEQGDTDALAQIASIAKAYRGSAAGLAALTVPPELVAPHLMLVNSLARLAEITTDFTRVEDDMLAAMLALGQYGAAVQDLATSLAQVGKIYANAGIVFAGGAPGASFVNLMADISAKK